MYYCTVTSTKTATIKIIFSKTQCLLDHHQKFGGEEYWKFENANGECHWQ